jgi:hypothetical protein
MCKCSVRAMSDDWACLARWSEDPDCRRMISRFYALDQTDRAAYTRGVVNALMASRGLAPYDAARFQYESGVRFMLHTIHILYGLEMLLCHDAATVCCTICMDTLPVPYVRLPCGHAFHLLCVGRWIHLNGRCPNCRAEVRLPMFWNLLTL